MGRVLLRLNRLESPIETGNANNPSPRLTRFDSTTTTIQNVRRVCGGNLVALMSNDDPYRGLDDGGLCNQKDWEEMVGARVVMRRGKGHFNCLKLDAEDLAFVERDVLGLVRRGQRPDAASGPRFEEGGGGRGEKRLLKRGQFRSRL